MRLIGYCVGGGVCDMLVCVWLVCGVSCTLVVVVVMLSVCVGSLYGSCCFDLWIVCEVVCEFVVGNQFWLPSVRFSLSWCDPAVS